MIFILISQNLGLDSGLSVALFPMVILTMTIERMCITWDERGASEAIKSGIGSLVSQLSLLGHELSAYAILSFCLSGTVVSATRLDTLVRSISRLSII